MGYPLFIVIDGIDGSGKGENLIRLHDFLYTRSKRISLLSTREPTYSKYGAQIRSILQNEDKPKAQAEKCFELFVKDREEHLSTVIRPFLQNSSGNNINAVLCDRYLYSTIAFQHAQGISVERLLEANNSFLVPDITFVLDVPPEIAMKRHAERSQRSLFSFTDSNAQETEKNSVERFKAAEKDKFEDPHFMAKVRTNYLKLKEWLPNHNIVFIDASLGKEEVFEQIKVKVDLILQHIKEQMGKSIIRVV